MQTNLFQRKALVYLVLTQCRLPCLDTGDNSAQQDQYDFGSLSGSDTKRQMHYQNNLNVINSVLLRKLAINKLSR